MKKNLFFAASIAALVLAGCTEDEYLSGNAESQNSLGEISFASKNQTQTRANLEDKVAADSLGGNFVVIGYKNTTTTDGVGSSTTKTSLVFDHYNVKYSANTAGTTLSNSSDWEYVATTADINGVSTPGNIRFTNASTLKEQTIKYWDYSAGTYEFFAFSLGKGVSSEYATVLKTAGATDGGVGTLKYTFTGNAKKLGGIYVSDMTTVTKGEAYGNPVTLTFRHVSPKVRIGIYDAVPGYKVTGISFYNGTDQTGTANTPILYAESGNYFHSTTSDNTTYTLQFVKTSGDGGTPVVYDKTPTVTITTPESADASYQTFTSLGFVKGSGGDADNTYGVSDNHPLGESSLTASMTDYNYVFPAGATYSATSTDVTIEGKPLTLTVDFTLTSNDGTGEVINVKSASAIVPAEYCVWQQGYAYTYIFKISPKTNGTTGGNDDPTGLAAITFDAVVTDYDNQETTTTIGGDEKTTTDDSTTTIETTSASITTSGKLNNVAVTGMSEYPGGTEITAQIEDDIVTKYGKSTSTNTYETSLTAKLYTVTLSEGASTENINEATVSNAIAKGTQSTATVGSVSDCATYTLKLTEPVTLTVTEATNTVSHDVSGTATTCADVSTKGKIVWTADPTATVYAVEFSWTDASNNTHKSYKVVRVTAPTFTVSGTQNTDGTTYTTNNAVTVSVNDGFSSLTPTIVVKLGDDEVTPTKTENGTVTWTPGNAGKYTVTYTWGEYKYSAYTEVTVADAAS